LNEALVTPFVIFDEWVVVFSVSDSTDLFSIPGGYTDMMVGMKVRCIYCGGQEEALPSSGGYEASTKVSLILCPVQLLPERLKVKDSVGSSRHC